MFSSNLSRITNTASHCLIKFFIFESPRAYFLSTLLSCLNLATTVVALLEALTFDCHID
jgi:hypothetical protein